MTEWWTYRPADLLMFAPGTYWRLFELQNAASWPAPVLLPVIGLGWLGWFAWQPGTVALRTATFAAAAACACTAWFFLLQRYAPINWAASAFAAGLGALAALWLTAGFFGEPAAAQRGPRRIAGLLLGWALLLQPLLAAAFGGPLAQAEVFGLAPDPTVLGCIGLLLCSGVWRARWLPALIWALCLLWCAISIATLWTMGSAQAAVLAALVLLAMCALIAERAGHAGRGRTMPNEIAQP